MPGSHNVSYPCIRRRRTSASWMVWSRAWPMCSEPVTFGGGITIVYAGRSLPASARKYPADTHRSYLGCSTSPGTYWAGRCGMVEASGVVVTVRVYGCTPDGLHTLGSRARKARRASEPAARMAPTGRRAAPNALAEPVAAEPGAAEQPRADQPSAEPHDSVQAAAGQGGVAEPAGEDPPTSERPASFVATAPVPPASLAASPRRPASGSVRPAPGTYQRPDGGFSPVEALAADAYPAEPVSPEPLSPAPLPGYLPTPRRALPPARNPAVPRAISGPPARAVSGPPARIAAPTGSSLSTDRPRTLVPATIVTPTPPPPRRIKGMIAFVVVLLSVLVLGMTGYF